MKNKKVVIIIGCVVLFVVVCLIIRGINMSRKNNISDTPEVTPPVVEDFGGGLEQDVEPTASPSNSYVSGLGLGSGKTDGRVDVEEATPTPEITPEPIIEAAYGDALIIWGNTSIPKRNQDGSNCKDYLKKVKLKDFGTMWGSSLTEADFDGGVRYLIGVDQNPENSFKGDCQSVGWVMDNMDKFNENDALQFTDLHVIGSLSDTHVALLCSYNFYSVFGMTDTLVMFEDISGTLDVGMFGDGDIFSAVIYAHNIKLLNKVNGKRVLCVQYNVFD